MRSFLIPKFLRGNDKAFTPATPIHSSSPKHYNQKPLLTRLKIIILHNFAIIHLLYIILCLAALAISITRAILLSQTNQTTSSSSTSTTPYTNSRIFKILVYLITHVFWLPLLVWVRGMFACLGPISYAIWPLKGERSGKDTRKGSKGEKEAIERVGREVKGVNWGRWGWFDSGLKWVLMAYCLFVFVASWFY